MKWISKKEWSNRGARKNPSANYRESISIKNTISAINGIPIIVFMLIEKQINAEILSNISVIVGYEIKEDSIDIVTLFRIKKLVEIKKIIYILKEVFRGENTRVKNHFLLRVGDKINNEKALLEVQFGLLQSQLNTKIKEIAESILMGKLQYNDKMKEGSEVVQLNKRVEINCPSCNSSLLNEGYSILLCRNCGKQLTKGEIIPLIDNVITSI